MAKKLIVRPEAEQDVDEACGWYESQRAGLGDEFLAAVRQCIKAIHRKPEIFATILRHYRRALLKRFPYVVFYHVDADAIVVHAVFHQARDPKIWSERLG